MISRSLLVVAVLAGIAGADPVVEQLAKYWAQDYVPPAGQKPPRIALAGENRASPTWAEARMNWRGPSIAAAKQLAGTTADKRATWVAGTLESTIPCEVDATVMPHRIRRCARRTATRSDCSTQIASRSRG